MTPEFIQALARALVIGVFGGVALVLTILYSRRGPLIYAVYAAILFTLGLSLSRATSVGFAGRLWAAYAAVGVSTVSSIGAVVQRSAAQRRRYLASGEKLARGHAPVWAFPLLILTLFAASAGVAFVSL